MNSAKQSKVMWFTSITLSLTILAVGSLYVRFSNLGGAQPSLRIVNGVSNYQGQPDNYAPIARTADIIVEGVIADTLTSKWTTPDGKAPEAVKNMLSRANNSSEATSGSFSSNRATTDLIPNSVPVLQATVAPVGTLGTGDTRVFDPKYQISTPVVLSVQRVFKGKNVKDTIIFTVLGGTVDDVTMSADDGIYKPGTHLIVFLYKGQPASPPAIAHVDALFPSMPLIVDGSIAHGPLKNVALEELIRQIQEGTSQ